MPCPDGDWLHVALGSSTGASQRAVQPEGDTRPQVLGSRRAEEVFPALNYGQGQLFLPQQAGEQPVRFPSSPK